MILCFKFFAQFAGNLSLNLSLFLFFLFFFFFFLFYRSDSKFIKFRVFLKVLFCISHSWIFLVELQQSTFIYFYFLGRFIQEVSVETNLQANFSCFDSSVSEFVLSVRLVVLDKKEEVPIWCSTIWDYFSHLHSGPNQVSHVTG